MSEVLTRNDMIARYGSIPFAIPQNSPYRWTISRAHADVTWVTQDGGATWSRGTVIWAEARATRDLAALEQQRIQRELK